MIEITKYVLPIVIFVLSTNAYPAGKELGYAFNKPTVSPYGDTFGYQGLPYNSYLTQSLIRYWDSLKVLTSSLFYRPETKEYNKDEFYKKWNDNNDKEWRKTTRAPYFDNKIPGDHKVLAASAVINAATAFGVVSLLPLNVPTGQPLMYCGNTDIIQSQLRINNQDIYVCNKDKIEIICSKKSEVQKCVNEELKEGFMDNIYYSDGTLKSMMPLFCNSTITVNEEVTILNCYDGQLPRDKMSFIPTTTSTESPYSTTTTQKSLSFGASLHVAFLKILGKSRDLETTTQKVIVETFPYPDSMSWHPEALTIPPETTTEEPKRTTAKPPFVYMEKHYIYHDNGTIDSTLRPVPKELLPLPYDDYRIIPPDWIKIYTTTTEAVTESTSTTTESPFVWMRKMYSNDNAERYEPVPKFMVKIAKQYSPQIPSNWVKVPASEGLMDLINFKENT